MAWKSIIGQERVVNLFISLLQQHRLAQAYVFSGEEGVGKDAVGIELAKVLNCERKSFEACDACSSCVKFQSLQHPNLHLIFALPVGKGEESHDSPLEKLSDEQISAIKDQIALKAENRYHKILVSKANTVKVNSIRAIRRASSLTSYGGGKSVFIIMDSEQLNDESSNALLKTLEEPHDNVVLILTTAHPDLLLPTIMSRCQHVRFDSLPEEEIQRALEQREGVESVRAATIARIANGSYSHALDLIPFSIMEERQMAVKFLRASLGHSRADLAKAVDEIVAGSERPEIERFLYLLQSWLRDAMGLREGVERVVNIDNIEALRNFAGKYPHVDYTLLFHAVRRAISLLSKNVYIQLVLMNLAIELKKRILPAFAESRRDAGTGN